MCMSKRQMPCSHVMQRGFTLIELIIFIVVIGAGLAGILAVSTTVVKASADPLVNKQAMAIAESLLEEILLKAHTNPVDGYTGSVRAQFDDVSDFLGYSTSGGVVDLQGNVTPALSAYNYNPPVTVGVASAAEFPNGVAAKKITVFVTSPGGVISLTGYRGVD